MIGQSIRDLIGFNLTGMDFNDLDLSVEPEVTRKRQLGYHDYPYGRVVGLHLRFSNDISAICELTLLPVWGKDRERVLFCLLQPPYGDQRDITDHQAHLTTGAAEFMYLDLGNGVPDRKK